MGCLVSPVQSNMAVVRTRREPPCLFKGRAAAAPYTSTLEGAVNARRGPTLMNRAHVGTRSREGRGRLLEFWLGIVAVTAISLAGWLISSSGAAAPYTVFLAVVGLVLLSAGIVFVHRRIERRIAKIKEL
jgi:hypothetical protein